MTEAQICMMITMGVYLVFMVVVGAMFSKSNKSAGDFYLGGRKLGPLVTAMSAEASDMSSWLLMGLPGVAYLSGIADAGWTALGLAVGTYINWLIVSKRIRKYSDVCGAITIPDFFNNRFRDDKHILMGISAVIIIIFFIPYTASGFAACGKLFSSLFGVDYLPAMLISAAIIVLYTTLGGFLAASTTDFIQSIIMTVALLIVMVFATVSAGGLGAVIENAKSLPGYLSMLQTYSVESGTAQPHTLLTICSTMAWGLGYFGMPHILLRFMAIKDREKLTTSRRVATVWVFISLAIAVFIGIAGLGMSKVGAIETLSGSDSETVIVKIAGLLGSFGIFPAIVAGLILAGILASTMSTADSQLLAAGSSISQNILRGVFGIKMNDKTAVITARATLIVISIIAVFLAQDPNSSVFEIVSFAWAGFGASFGPVVLFALFWRRTNRWGALAGMLSGGAMVFIWKFVIAKLGGVFAIYELLPAFIVASVMIVAVSLLTPAPSKEITDEFDMVKATD